MPKDMRKKLAEAKPAGEIKSFTGSFSAPRSKAQFLENLYRSHWNDLVGWLHRRYGAGPPDPEDIAQTAFESMAALEDVTRVKNPRAYLFSTAVYAALKGVKWMARTRKMMDAELLRHGQNVEDISPERLYSARERFETVMREVGGLSPKQREIIIRSRIEGQTYDEITEATGWSKAEISRQLKAAMHIIRRAVEQGERAGGHHG